MRDFDQAYVSDVLPHFKKGFMDKWGFKEYTDPTKPAVFLGLYSSKDINVFKNHKSYKILHFGGNDFHSPQIEIVRNSPNTFLVGYGWLGEGLIQNNLPYKEVIVPLKSYDEFTPTPLGENIYIYKGLHGTRYDYFKWNEIVKPLQQVFGEDRIIYTEHKSIEEVRENYYNNCFVYVKPNERGGSTSMWELGHMGRKTITFNQGNLPNVLNFVTLDDIIQHIMEESTKIGTIQKEVAKQTYDVMINSDKWLNIDYYES